MSTQRVILKSVCAAVFFMFKKFGGNFDPLGLISGVIFKYWGLGVISYIMYILVTSDVNKNANIFLGSLVITMVSG